MGYACKVIADSLNRYDVRLTTMEVTFPRIVLAEFNTHRMFSRNSASSRAIPIERQMELIAQDPFIPIYWGKNQPGMQALREMEPEEREDAISSWLDARDYALGAAKGMMELGVHKQITNRLLEPFMWHTVVVTATDWLNFFNLRAPKGFDVDPSFGAQPEIQQIAIMMRNAYMDSDPVEYGDLPTDDNGFGLHLPYLREEEIEIIPPHLRMNVSAARCARVSYLRQGEERAIAEDLDRCNDLILNGHFSPLEHPAKGGGPTAYQGNFKGWWQFRKTIKGEAVFQRPA